MTEPTPTLADIYAKCEEIRAQQVHLDGQFATWDALIARQASAPTASTDAPHGPQDAPGATGTDAETPHGSSGRETGTWGPQR